MPMEKKNLAIEKLRRLKYLSEMPTHSPETLKELETLVNRVIGGYVMSDDFCHEYHISGCDLCRHQLCCEHICEHYEEYPENDVDCSEWIDECKYYPDVCKDCDCGSNFEMKEG